MFGILKFLVAERYFHGFIIFRFNNAKNIKKVTCPLLLLHGQRDDLIPLTHSQELRNNTGGPSELILPEDMDHNEFNLYEDFLDPISNFLRRHNLIEIPKNLKIVEIPKELFELPDYITNTDVQQNRDKDVFSKLLRKFLKI